MTDKPKRPATSGTRKGNGSGKGSWGGPAKGAGTSDAPPATPFGAGNKAAAGYHDMSKSERLAKLDELKWNIAMGLTKAENVQLAAAMSFEDRHLGKARQSMELSGVDGEPIKHDGTLTVVFKRPSAGD